MIPGGDHQALLPVLLFALGSLTCSKIDYDVYEEYCVGETIEHNPSSWKIVIKEGYGYRKYDKVGDQKKQHTQVPVKSEKRGRRNETD